MHELSIALSVLDIVSAACAERRLGAVRAVRVRIGAATGLEPESLRFAFDCSKAGTPAAAAALEIEPVPLGGVCDGCGEFDTAERYVLACPRCGGASFRITRGDELQVIDLEVDE
jgi:hydrogenase nickel incorporation protein HypA/HybF